jgi:hypothetical protein
MTNQEPARYYHRENKKIRYNICICGHLICLFKVSSNEVHQGGKKSNVYKIKSISLILSKDGRGGPNQRTTVLLYAYSAVDFTGHMSQNLRRYVYSFIYCTTYFIGAFLEK